MYLGSAFEKTCLLGTSLVRVRASEPYESSSVGIRYVFIAQSIRIQFNLDHNRGEMKTLSTLDYDEIKKCSMVLEARNGGKGGLVA